MIKLKHKLLISCLALGLLAGCTTTTTTTTVPNGTANNSGHLVDKKLVAANANIQLGMNYLQKGDVTTAKQKLLLALDLAPHYPAAWYTMAYYLEATGDYQKANEYYLHAIELAPTSGDAQNNYGTFLCHTGKPKQAIQHFLAAVQDPKYIDTAAAYENAGLCALRIPDLKEARHYFSKAVRQDPQRGRSLAELAAVDYHLGNYSNASDSLNQLFLSSKPTPATLLLAARTADKLNQKQKAQQYMSQLQQQFPNSDEARSLNKTHR